MLTIKESENKNAAKEFLKKHADPYEIHEDDIVMCCEENGNILGVSALRLKNGKVYLNLLVFSQEMSEKSLELGLARAIMNLADLRGISFLYGSNPQLGWLYSALRFQQNEEEYCLSLDGYFTAKHE